MYKLSPRFCAKKDEIKDLYNFLLLLLKVQLDSLLEDKRLADVVRGHLTRKLV